MNYGASALARGQIGGLGQQMLSADYEALVHEQAQRHEAEDRRRFRVEAIRLLVPVYRADTDALIAAAAKLEAHAFGGPDGQA